MRELLEFSPISPSEPFALKPLAGAWPEVTYFNAVLPMWRKPSSGEELTTEEPSALIPLSRHLPRSTSDKAHHQVHEKPVGKSETRQRKCLHCTYFQLSSFEGRTVINDGGSLRRNNQFDDSTERQCQHQTASLLEESP